MDHRKKILDLHYFENSGTKTLTEVDLKRIEAMAKFFGIEFL